MINDQYRDIAVCVVIHLFRRTCCLPIQYLMLNIQFCGYNYHYYHQNRNSSYGYSPFVQMGLDHCSPALRPPFSFPFPLPSWVKKLKWDTSPSVSLYWWLMAKDADLVLPLDPPCPPTLIFPVSSTGGAEKHGPIIMIYAGLDSTHISFQAAAKFISRGPLCTVQLFLKPQGFALLSLQLNDSAVMLPLFYKLLISKRSPATQGLVLYFIRWIILAMESIFGGML